MIEIETLQLKKTDCDLCYHSIFTPVQKYCKHLVIYEDSITLSGQYLCFDVNQSR